MPVIKLLNFYRTHGTATVQDIFIKDEMMVKKSESRSQFEEKSFLLICYRPRSD